MTCLGHSLSETFQTLHPMITLAVLYAVSTPMCVVIIFLGPFLTAPSESEAWKEGCSIIAPFECESTEFLFMSYSCQTRLFFYRPAIDPVGQVLQFTVLGFHCKFVSRGFFDWLNWGQRHSLAVVPVESVFGWLCHHTHDDFPALFHPVLWARSLYTHQCLLPVEKAFPSTPARYFTCKDWLWRVAQGWSLDKHLTAISTLHENRRSVTTLVLFHSYANTIIPESWKSLFHPCCERRSKTTWSAWQLTNSARAWRALEI